MMEVVVDTFKNYACACLLSVAMASSTKSVKAHEFWIAPERGIVATGEVVRADLKVGQTLQGESYPYLSKRFRVFTDTVGAISTAVTGIEGDIPAFEKIAALPGLHVIAHETIPFRVTYDDWAVFRRYLADEGLDRFAELHRSRGLPDSGFAERYTRYVKALVQVGPVRAADRDASVGMRLELIAEANPYAPGIEALPVQLLWQGQPVAGQQINVFYDGRDDIKSTVITDAVGRTKVPIGGVGQYLLNAVYLTPVDDARVVWASHWATLSFKL